MKTIEFVKDKIPFTQVANGVLQNPKLSAKSKGLYAYLYSKPDGWDFAVARICLEMADGKDSINQGLRELERHGYVTRSRQSDGRVVYMVHFPPIKPFAEKQQMGQKPFAEKPTVGKTHSGKIGNISNKEEEVIKIIQSNKDSEQGSQEIALLIKSFESINPACKQMYGNKTQRKACGDLIETYTFERIDSIIKNTLPKTNGKVYFPTITTPVQLRDRFASLESAIAKYQNRNEVGKKVRYIA